MKTRLFAIAALLLAIAPRFGTAMTPPGSNECSPEQMAKAAKACKAAHGIGCDSCSGRVDYKKTLADAIRKQEQGDSDGSGKEWVVDAKHPASALPVGKIQSGDTVEVNGPVAVEKTSGRMANGVNPVVSYRNSGPYAIVPVNLASKVPLGTPVDIDFPNGQSYTGVPVRDYGPPNGQSARVEVAPGWAARVGLPGGTIGSPKYGSAKMVIRVPKR